MVRDQSGRAGYAVAIRREIGARTTPAAASFHQAACDYEIITRLLSAGVDTCRLVRGARSRSGRPPSLRAEADEQE